MTTIEFGLPCGAGGMAAAYQSQQIRRQLTEWSSRYNIPINTDLRLHDHRSWLRVEFNNEQDLTVFALTWNTKTFMPWQQR